MSIALYRFIAQRLHAHETCKQSGNSDWALRHANAIRQAVESTLPHGSGFDAGTELDFAASRPERLVFSTSFHHMDEFGGYGGWTEHTVIVTPSLSFGINVRVTGRDRNGIKEYIGEAFDTALQSEYSETAEQG